MSRRRLLVVVLTLVAGTLLGVTRAPLWAGIIAVCVISPVGCWLWFGPFVRAAGGGDT